MNQSPFSSLHNIAPVEIAAGFFSRLIHTPANTINFIEVAAGHSIRLHQHKHHQVSIVLHGQFEMTVDGHSAVMKEGVTALLILWYYMEGGPLPIVNCSTSSAPFVKTM